MNLINKLTIESKENSKFELTIKSLFDFLLSSADSWFLKENPTTLKIKDEIYYISNKDEIIKIFVDVLKFEKPEIIPLHHNNWYIINLFKEKLKNIDTIDGINCLLYFYKKIKFYCNESKKTKSFIKVYKNVRWFYKCLKDYKDVLDYDGYVFDLKKIFIYKKEERNILNEICNPILEKDFYEEYKKLDNFEKKYILMSKIIKICHPYLQTDDHNKIDPEIIIELNKYLNIKKISHHVEAIYRHNINDPNYSKDSEKIYNEFSIKNEDEKIKIMDIHVIIFLTILAIITKFPNGNKKVDNLIKNLKI